MMNKCNAGFVSLEGNWCCPGCGWSNCGCDTCANCGWNRWGCNNSCGCGGVVSVGTARSRNAGCSKSDDCGGTYVQPRNTDCNKCDDCGNAYTQPRNTDCNKRDDCDSAYVQPRNTDCNKRDDCDSAYVQPRNTDCNKCDDCGSAYVQARNTDCNKCDDCGSAYVQPRNTDCSKCDDCGSAYTQPRNTDCNKCDDCGGNRSRSRRNRGVGMVWGVKQELDQVFECDSALRTGTLFPELHKPMSGYCPGECNCQTDGQAASFSAWDLRLYLNTHPDDKQAMALFRRLCEEAGEPNYATTFLEDGCGASDWGWTDDPWPWERRPCGK